MSAHRGQPERRESVLETYRLLRAAYPGAACSLAHRDLFDLLVAVVLSAQTTDVSVNRIMPTLMERYPDARSLALADVTHVEAILRSIGMYRQKARNVIALATKLACELGGVVPRSVAGLMELPGVGRKTANVVLGEAFGIAEGIAVDTHVMRVSHRLGWTKGKRPEDVERDLQSVLPRNEWIECSHVLIFHGRRVCGARAPACGSCCVSSLCPSAFAAEEVGRRTARHDPQNARRAGTNRG